jgi:HEPN domain-containing protein
LPLYLQSSDAGKFYMKKNKNDLLKSWIQKADEDYSVANLLKKRKKYSMIACFHLQQAIEKYLKAYLIFFDLEPPKTHNLEDLLNLLRLEDPNLTEFQVEITDLTPFAVNGRYPEYDEIGNKE